MIATTTTVTTRKTPVKLTADEVKQIILDHIKDVACKGSPEVYYVGDGGVYVDFIEEDVHEEDALKVADDKVEIDWAALPDAAQWVAMDNDGEWYWYEEKPDFRITIWTSDGKGGSFDGPTCDDWTASLQSRPSPAATIPSP